MYTTSSCTTAFVCWNPSPIPSYVEKILLWWGAANPLVRPVPKFLRSKVIKFVCNEDGEYAGTLSNQNGRLWAFGSVLQLPRGMRGTRTALGRGLQGGACPSNCSAFARSNCPKRSSLLHIPFLSTFTWCLEETPALLERNKRVFLCQAFSSAIHLQHQPGKHRRGFRAPRCLRARWITPSQLVLVKITHANKTNESVLYWQRWALCTVALGYEIKLITFLL